jgi:hypothetical protein
VVPVSKCLIERKKEGKKEKNERNASVRIFMSPDLSKHKKEENIKIKVSE